MYKIKWCPLCDQGWVKIVKEINTNKLYLCCNECESEWNDVTNISEKTCLPFNSYGKYKDPNFEEIQINKWDKYILPN